MSKIFKEKKVTNYDSKLPFYLEDNNKNNNFFIKSLSIFSSATKEWRNSIYCYDKNSIKLLPVSDKTITKLIKSYFNLTDYVNRKNKNLRKKYSRLSIIKRRLSIKKIFVSKADLKHTNSRVIITVYIYNAIEKYLTARLKKLNNRLVFRKGQYKNIILKAKKQEINLMIKIKKQVKIITKQIPLWEKQTETYKKDFINKFLMRPQRNLVNKKLETQFLIFRFLSKIYFHRSKVNYLQLAPLRYLISKIYNKEVLFNIVNLKYLFLNSDIFSQPVAKKLMNRKIRLLKVFKFSMSVLKIPSLEDINFEKYQNLNPNKVEKPFFEKLNNFFISGLNKKNKDIIHQTLLNKFNVDSDTEDSIIESLYYTLPIGVRIQASGRLSRRFTASRSLSKFKYKGTLKNLPSSKLHISSTFLRGHVKSNLQYTNINSKTRNGSFGLKGWIGSY